MEPDIYEWLRERQTITSPSGITYDVRRFKEAADEIERLRELAYLLIDELRFNGGYEAYTPKMLFDEFYEQAVRGD